MFAAAMVFGIFLDTLIGWPDGVFRRIKHPVVWIGAVITWLEIRFNAGRRNAKILRGGLVVLLVLATCIVPAVVVQAMVPSGFGGAVILGVCAWPLIAMRSLYDHVFQVSVPLINNDLEGARTAVSMIVGRDPSQLDDAGVARAAIESLAENASDGVVAPLFWGLIAGLPGIVAYKAINTMDSMIGHKSERYEAFGKIAARLDDVVNWIPARLTGVLFALASVGRTGEAFRVVRMDAKAHRSMNAGWPEGAMAGAMNIRLSGPRIYENHTANEPWLNADAPDPSAADLSRALRLYLTAMALLALALAALALL